MTNEELKETIREMVDEDEVADVVVLEGDEFADGCVGITTDNHLVYDYDKLTESLAKTYLRDGTAEDTAEAENMAVDWLEVNTLGSMDCMRKAGKAPIIMRGLLI